MHSSLPARSHRYRPVGWAGLVALGVVVGAHPAAAQAPAPKTPKPADGAASTAAPTGVDPTGASGDAKAVIDFRPKSLLQNPMIGMMLTQVPPDAPSEIRALVKGDIEQILVLVGNPSAAPEPGSPPVRATVLLRASKTYDWSKFSSQKTTEVKKGGATYLRTEGAGPGVVCYRTIDDRTLMVAPESDITAPLMMAGAKPGKHAWDDGWKQLKPGATRIAVDAAWARQLSADARKKAPPEVMQMVGPLIDKPTAYTLLLSDKAQPSFDLMALTATEGDAKDVAATLNNLLQMGRDALPGLKEQLGGPAAANNPQVAMMFGMAENALKSARVEPSKAGTRLTMDMNNTAVVAAGTALLLPAVQAAREAARRAQSVNNLKQVGLAMHNYHNKNGAFPAAAVLGPDGRTPHSWRVELLPFLEQESLFKEYKMDEPWDGPSNRKLVERMPSVFKDPSSPGVVSDGKTSYFAFTGPTTIFSKPGKTGMKIEQVTDGTSNTIMVVEAKRDVPWTKPEDIAIDAGKPLPSFGGFHPGGFNVLFADGSVRFLKALIKPESLKALITPSGGETITADSFGAETPRRAGPIPHPPGIGPARRLPECRRADRKLDERGVGTGDSVPIGAGMPGAR